MNEQNDISQLTDTLSAPLGDLISAVGNGVAEAQKALDAQVLKQLESLNINDDQTINNLRKIGYQPTWYQIPEASAELLVSLSLSGSKQGIKKQGVAPLNLYAAPVNATYMNSFDYNLQAFSKVAFKVVPVPPTTAADSARIMPNLIHKTVEEARQLLEQLGIAYRFENEAVADHQKIIDSSISAGEVMTQNEQVVLSNV